MTYMSTSRTFSNRRPDGPLEDDEIASRLRQRIEDALNRPDGDVSRTRTRMLERYRGDPLGEEEEGRSTFCTREIFEMVEAALPGLLSVFFSYKNPVAFRARRAEDVEAAAQETDVVDHFLFRRDNSFIAFHDIFKDALINPVAYCKVHCTHVEETREHHFEGLTSAGVKMALGNRNWKEGLEVTEVEDPEQPEGKSFTFKGVEIYKEPRFHVEAVPPEQVLVDRMARYLDLDQVWEDYGFICHKTPVAYTDLVKRGYDEDELDDVAKTQDTDVEVNAETINRKDRDDERPHLTSTNTDYSTRRFTVYECYVKMDCDGTGIADGWRIVIIGNKVFEKERVSYQPMIATSAIPMPHKHVGMSPSEALEDLQKLKTKLMRVLLNNLYDNESKTGVVDKNALTAQSREQLMDPQARWVFVNGNPSQSIRQLESSPIIQETMASLQHADDMVKRRTGMAPDNALNPDVLRDATAHGMLASMDKQSSRLMHIARLLAETCVKKVGVKLHQLLRMYQVRPLVLELRGKWVDVNPVDWAERTEMRVMVGLGFNSPEQRVAAYTQLLQLQKEALPQGLSDPKLIKNTIEQLVENANVGHYEQFFLDPGAPGWKPPPPQPDPQMEAIKAQVQITQAQERTKQAELAASAKRDEAKSLVEAKKVEVDRERILADAKLKQVEAKMAGTFLPELKLREVRKLDAEIAKLKAETAKLGADVASTAAQVDKTRAEARMIAKEPDDGPDTEDSDE